MTLSFSPRGGDDSFADLLSTIIVFAKGQLADGGRYWAYIAMPPSMVASFKKAQGAGTLELEDYGTIIEWDKGNEPPADVVERMKRDYAVGSDYEKKLLERLEQL